MAGSDGPIVLAAGRLSPEKGFSVLVEAANWVRERVPNVRFVVFGEGPERSRLELQIGQLGLTDVLRLVGFSNDLDAMIPWAQCVVLPSFTEGLPNVALEAGAAGVPIVATAVGGTPEVVVDGETGFLIAPGDAKSLASRIVELLANPDKARRLASPHFGMCVSNSPSRRKHAPYEELFSELVGARNRGSAPWEAACA